MHRLSRVTEDGAVDSILRCTEDIAVHRRLQRTCGITAEEEWQNKLVNYPSEA